MAAVLSFALGSLAERATAAPPLAAPALAVKAERQRSYTVLEKRRHEEIEQRAAAKVAPQPRLTVLYECRTRLYERKWYFDTMFAGHEIVCFSKATVDDVQRAAVLVDTFVNHRNRAAGLSVSSLVLNRLNLPASVLHGKVLVHINDEYGGRPLNDKLSAVYCELYAPFRWVFRTYWSSSWTQRVDGQGHWHNCTSQVCSGAPTRVEWVPLGWSSNWQPRHTVARRFVVSSERRAFIGFYGNEKAKTHRGKLIAMFEQQTRLPVNRSLGHSGFGKGNASEYVDKMRDTQLCLQIAGLSSECYRLYEALDAGCVPIVVDNLAAQNQATASEQYRFLLHGGGALPGDGSAAPFPHAATPSQLAELLAQLRGNGGLLDELQAKTDRWWLRTLGRIIARVISVAESDPCAKLGTRLRRQAQVDHKARWS